MNRENISMEKGIKKDGKFFFDLANLIMVDLSKRSQEIIKKRFGLETGEIETLEKIGSDFQVTRERVRQIISDSIKKIAKTTKNDAFKIAEEKIILEISKKDGIISEESLFKKLAFGDTKEEKAIVFIISCSNQIIKTEISGMLKKAYILSDDILDKVREISKVAKEVIFSSGVPMSDTRFVDEIVKINNNFAKNQVLNLLGVLDGITRNKFGKWGFSNWMEINPKGTKERIYLILKEKKKPLHFMQIAKFIDEAGISKRKSHPQTVHNELIKDDRFVLIGRGTYALREWGYTPGTIKDVIKDILKRNNKPMTKEELLEEIIKFRQVKKTTVMINLNNKNEFVRRNDKYFLKNNL